MSYRYEKLKALLKELFQLDQPDLDFGLYRVIHAKSAEVSKFLDDDLLPQVRAAFARYRNADKTELEKELSKVMAGVEAAGMNPDKSPKVKELRARLKSDAVDIAALESEVYDHLFSFFRRYYSEGDFLAKRVYKPGVYAIPYEGEEVTLHWANKDQYYIKTSEYLRDYAFRLRPDDQDKPMRVHFRLADIAEGEHGNVKAAEGENRVFVLAAPGASGHDFIVEEARRAGQGTRHPASQYRPATLTDWPEEDRDGKKKPPVQKGLSALAIKRILAASRPCVGGVDHRAGQAARHGERRTGRLQQAGGAPQALHRSQHLRLLHPQGPRDLPPPGAGLLHQERNHAPGRRGERVRAARRTVPLQDQGHPQDRGQDHRLSSPNSKISRRSCG